MRRIEGEEDKGTRQRKRAVGENKRDMEWGKEGDSGESHVECKLRGIGLQK